MVKIPDFAQVGLQPGGMQAYNDAAIRPLDVDAGREAQQMGRALEQVGRGLGDYASSLLTQARMEQNDLNRSYAVEAFVDYRSKVDKDLYDPQTGYFNKGGKAAFEGERDAVFGRMQQYLDDAEKALPNQAAKDLFRNRALLFAEERGLQVDLHAGKERKVYQNAVDEQLLQAEQADVPMLWKDADMQAFQRDPYTPKTEFQMRLEAFQKSIRDVGARRGSAPEVIEANVEAATTAVYAQVVDREADPKKALKLFDQFVADKKIVTQDPQKARTMLQNKVSANVGQETAAQLWDQFGGDYDLAANALNEKRRNGELDVEAFNKGDAQLGLLQRQKATAFASRGLSALQAARKWMDDPANSKAEIGDMPPDMVTALRDTDMLDTAESYMANQRRFLNKTATLDEYARMSADGSLGLLSSQQLEAKFRGGADDAMYSVIVRDWQRQSGVAMQQQQPQSAGSASRGRQASEAIPEALRADLLDRMTTAPGAITLTDAGKPSGSSSIKRAAYFEAEFSQRYNMALQSGAGAKDPLATAERIFNDMLKAWDPRQEKYVWEMLPSERNKAQVQMTVTYSDKQQPVRLSQLTPLERAQATQRLQDQGYGFGALSETQVAQEAVAMREALSAQRKQEREATGNRWVSWATVEQSLGFSRSKLLDTARDNPNESPLHLSDIVYRTSGKGWYGFPGQRYDADQYAQRSDSERDEHVGISRAAFERLLQVKRNTVSIDRFLDEVPSVMSFGQAREYVQQTSTRAQGASEAERAIANDKRAAAILAYELQFPELSLGRQEGSQRLAPAMRLNEEPIAPADVVREYNMLTNSQMRYANY